jgi:hypothetical protein
VTNRLPAGSSICVNITDPILMRRQLCVCASSLVSENQTTTYDWLPSPGSLICVMRQTEMQVALDCAGYEHPAEGECPKRHKEDQRRPCSPTAASRFARESISQQCVASVRRTAMLSRDRLNAAHKPGSITNSGKGVMVARSSNAC